MGMKNWEISEKQDLSQGQDSLTVSALPITYKNFNVKL